MSAFGRKRTFRRLTLLACRGQITEALFSGKADQKSVYLGDLDTPAPAAGSPHRLHGMASVGAGEILVLDSLS